MYSNLDMHYIQRDILLSLALSSPQRFSQLQPARVPNNTFSYHLRRLAAQGYVDQTDVGYVATRKALKTLQYTPTEQKKRHTPALISIIYVTNPRGEVLIRKRAKRPFVDHYSLPSGLIHTGETLEEAATRELTEKTGIVVTRPLKYAGVLDFRYHEEESNDIFVHAVAFVYTYETPNSLIPIPSNTFGTLGWSKLDHKDILPEVMKVHELIGQAPTVTSTHFVEPS